MRRLALLGLFAAGAPLYAQQPDPAYKVGVVSESGDIVTWLNPGDGRLTVDRVVPVGIMPADIDGPHNLAVAPDQRSYYVTIAHGTPFGSLWRLDAGTDTLIGRAPVELFPTTIAASPEGEFVFVANSDFHGDRPRQNVISIVHAPTMSKIADLPVCDMPHGMKTNRAGTKAYVSCMHSDELVEMDVATLGIARRAKTGSGHSMADATSAAGRGPTQHGSEAGSAPGKAPTSVGECSPTFVSVSADDRRLYVACNKSNTLQVWDAATLTKTREIPVGKGAYNVEASSDGKYVIVTNKKDQSVSLLDAKKLVEIARIPTSKKIVHGVAYSPDSRLAYISSESIGADPGSVDMIDLGARKVVATIAVPAQPTGIAILRRTR